MPTLFDILESHKKNKRDKRKFGLVIQGGGMRGVYSCGALTTLAEYGFSDTFDHVIGASAGAMNAVYFISNYKQPTQIYSKGATNDNFVNLMRRDKRVDIDYIIDTVLKEKWPINLPALKKAHTELHVIVTNASDGRKEVISDHKDFAEIYEELRASAALPLVYDKKVKLGDKYYVDGAVADSVPVDVALDLGCTDIVVVLTKQLSAFQFDQHHTRLVKHLVRRLARNQSAAVRRKLPTDELLLKVNLRTIRHPLKKTRIYVLEPSNEEIDVSLATIDKPKIKNFAKLGIKDMDKMLHKPID